MWLRRGWGGRLGTHLRAERIWVHQRFHACWRESRGRKAGRDAGSPSAQIPLHSQAVGNRRGPSTVPEALCPTFWRGSQGGRRKQPGRGEVTHPGIHRFVVLLGLFQELLQAS